MAASFLAAAYLLMGAACGQVSAASPSPVADGASVSGDAVRSSGGGLPQCEMHIEVDLDARLLHAIYDTPRLCYPQDEPLEAWKPNWVPIDYWVEHIDMELRDEPRGPLNKKGGWYMRPLGPAGGPYAIQARSGHNNGRATVYVTIHADGSLTVTHP